MGSKPHFSLSFLVGAVISKFEQKILVKDFYFIFKNAPSDTVVYNIVVTDRNRIQSLRIALDLRNAPIFL